jgi:hypothetical protein
MTDIISILSIDIGIINFAYCIFEYSITNKKFLIKKWDIINIATVLSQTTFVCGCLNKKKNKCNKPATYEKNNEYYCLVHAKSHNQYKIPININIKSFTKSQLQTFINNYSTLTSYSSPDNLLKTELSCIATNQLTELSKLSFNKIEKIKTNNIDLITIGRNINVIFNDIFSTFNFTHVLIENQISPIANRMKCIQGMVMQYFIIKNELIIIEFVSSSNKLKDQTTEKLTYNERKKIGISCCLNLLQNNNINNNQIEYFKMHKKKDDLADSFLQGYWYINNKL